MAIVHSPMSEREFTAVASGGRNRTLEEYHDRFFSDANISGGYSERFVSRMRGSVNEMQRVRRRVDSRLSTRKLRTAGMEDAYKQLSDIFDLQLASRRNRRALRANPNVSARYLRGECAGWDEDGTKVDYYNRRGHKHSNEMYRMITNGTVIKEEDGVYRQTQYLMDLNQTEYVDKELDAWARGACRINWSHIDHYLEAGEQDPTSVYNATL